MSKSKSTEGAKCATVKRKAKKSPAKTDTPKARFIMLAEYDHEVNAVIVRGEEN